MYMQIWQKYPQNGCSMGGLGEKKRTEIENGEKRRKRNMEDFWKRPNSWEVPKDGVWCCTNVFIEEMSEYGRKAFGAV